MIVKKAVIVLTKEEIDSSEEIELQFQVKEEGNEEDSIDYTINYPKEQKYPSLDEIENFLDTDEECQKILKKT